MSLSFILVLLVLISVVSAVMIKKLSLINVISDPNTYKRHVSVNGKVLVGVFIALLVAILQPVNWEKIDVGHKGLLINLLGDQRGAQSTKEVSGVVFYNKYTQEIQEIPLDQRHIEYEKQAVVAKGGYPCEIKPSFNYSVNTANSIDMFINLRSTYKQGQLEAIEKGWLANAIIGAINDVANRYPVDYLFNNREKFESEILLEVNKRAGKWFTVSQLKTNIQPPSSIKTSIEAKAKADADANTAEAQARVAKADAQRKIELAKGDSASVVINAASQAVSIKLRQAQLSQEYIEYIKATKWDGRMPTTVLGGGSNTLFNLK